MPLSTQEVKNLLKEVFRLVIALNKDDQTQALSAFSSILDTALVETDEYADMPPLVAEVKRGGEYSMPDLESVNEHVASANWKLSTAHASSTSPAEDDVRLIITETEQPKEELSVIDPDEGVEAIALNDDGEPEEEEEDAAEEEEEEEEEVAEEDVAEEEVAEEEVAEEEVAEEEVAEEEAVELDLEPVRIRKVIYWKDAATGDLYQYLPDDEVGDKVGSYVNGVPQFE
jgi:hypothetical protein